MQWPNKFPFRPITIGIFGLLLIIFLGAVPAVAEERDSDDGKITSGDPLDTLDYNDPVDINDDIQHCSESTNLSDTVIVIFVPGFKHQNFVFIVEVRNGLPRIRFEEISFRERSRED